MSASLIHCKTRDITGPPAVPGEEIWVSAHGFLRADPETDAAGGYIRITPTDATRPSFAIVPLTGPTDALTVIVWWLIATTEIGTTSGTWG